NLLCWVGHICRRLSAAAVIHLFRIGITGAFAAVVLAGISDKFKSGRIRRSCRRCRKGFSMAAGQFRAVECSEVRLFRRAGFEASVVFRPLIGRQLVNVVGGDLRMMATA
ncbi:MAG: hypothetical protein ACOVRM_10370, partial [Planctomycetaceae bacterium]